MNRTARATILTATVLWALLLAGSAAARDYLVVGSKPNFLYLIDPGARKVVHQFQIPGDGPPFHIVASPDGQVAYVATDHWGAISGIDLDSGKQVFRADLSTADMRIRTVGGVTLSRDGKELFVQEQLTRLLPGELQVQPPRVAVYLTNAGLKAEPVRSFEIPRRIAVLMPSVDGKTLYALGWDLYALDPSNGSIRKTFKVFHWNRPNASPPDVLTFWPFYEQSDVFSCAYYYQRTDLPEESPDAHKTGVLTFDLRTAELRMTDVENTSALVFSTVVNPRDHTQAFGTYVSLSRFNLGNKPGVEQRVDLDHTYYVVNISADGSEAYVGGAMSDVAVYSTRTMKKLGDIKLPGGNDMVLSLMRVVHRP